MKAVFDINDPVTRLKAAMAERKAVVEESNAELEALCGVAVESIEETSRLGISQTALAAELGVSRQRLWRLTRLEHGSR